MLKVGSKLNSNANPLNKLTIMIYKVITYKCDI